MSCMGGGHHQVFQIVLCQNIPEMAPVPQALCQHLHVGGGAADVAAAQESKADMILLDSGRGGTGQAFDWELVRRVRRPYLLAGGLNPASIGQAMDMLHPFGVDVSSGIETDGKKDMEKMRAFVYAVRGKDEMK